MTYLVNAYGLDTPVDSFADVALALVADMLSSGRPVAIASVAAELHKRQAHLGVLSAPRLKEVLERRFDIREGLVLGSSLLRMDARRERIG